MMGLSKELLEKHEDQFELLCRTLNLDNNTKEEAWESYVKTRKIFTLEVSSNLY